MTAAKHQTTVLVANSCVEFMYWEKNNKNQKHTMAVNVSNTLVLENTADLPDRGKIKAVDSTLSEKRIRCC